MDERADVIVVGLGPGGRHVAGALARAGLDVVGVEAEPVGGGFGTAGRVRRQAAHHGDDRPTTDDLAAWGVRLVRGTGRLAGPRRVAVDRSAFAARRGVVLATGARPRTADVAGLAATPYWTPRDVTAGRELPASLLVVGGGGTGVEIAQRFACAGSAVTVIEAGERLLAREEPEAGRLAASALRADGVDVLTGARVGRVEHDGVGFLAHVAGEPTVLAGERLLVATGRVVDLAGLGVDTVGLDPSAVAVPTDGRMRAGAGLWAVGDITGRGGGARMVSYQAEIAVRDVLGRPGPDADHRALPRVILPEPEIGAVGLTEQQARGLGLNVRTALASIASPGRCEAAGGEGFVKLIEDADRGVLVGATAAGPAGGGVLYGLQVAVHAEVPVARLQHMIHGDAAVHHAVEVALQALRRPARD
ncbi:FAD-dependent oxidoreductase [Catellatospora citrea]|uniref:Pyridine nucleotide-disulfide oxidoreductase n=1 Tax=Catellatospora citrea TaxID=53366 RepID=A0A8J3KGY1_9ACTN|nr:FAD-dependent oxidoreductase [Catellatospora citrea]RKE11256.1 pyruvate/2-oxoglutarate dehydrogenase complex dihydrolipoamide dehydrogenase (E3) component [Catellatospora citrea]GIF96723.1 pyridine nucleotide-disulfide oxidoreductase [Catellatospora citrea]